MSLAAVSKSLLAEIKSIVLHCIAFEGMLPICKILHYTTIMHTKSKFSICFFLAVALSLFFGFALVSIMSVKHFMTSQKLSIKA